MNNKISALGASLLLAASTMWGQSLTSLNGLVTDPTGAAIPAAKITTTEVNTGITRETESDGIGRYQFQALNPGLYKLTGKKDGFSDVSVQNLRLLVNTPATVNIAFEKVGAVAQTVEVTASGVQLNTVDASLGNSFGTKPIMQLPFEGRNVAKILSLQAGVSWVGDTDSVNGGVSAAIDRGGVVNGGRSDQSNLTLDGVDNNNQQSRAAFSGVLRVTLDSVQEFRVTTTNAQADASRGSGAQMSMVTKSGTNTLHGSAYHYLRNRALNANTFFNNITGLNTPKLNRNIFGASLGGPVKKNKLFLFGNYEGRRDVREDNLLRTVPTDSIRNGIASYVSRAGSVVQVPAGELASRLGYAPGANQAALEFLRSYPAANDFTAGDGLNSAGFRFNAPTKDKFDTYIAKLDWVVNSKHNAFVRGQLQDDVENGVPQFPGAAPNFQGLTNSKGLAFGLNSVWSNSLVSSTRYGITRQSFESAGIGQYALVRFGRFYDDRFGLTRSSRLITPTHNLTHDFTWTKGAHTFQFGGSYRQYTINRLNYGNSYFAASSNSSWMTGSGAILSAPWVGTDADPANVRIAPGSRTQFNDAVATIFGLVTQVTSNYNYLPGANGQVTALAPGVGAPRKFRGQESEIFAQDSWRIGRGITFTAGVRYHYWPAVYEAQGAQTSPNIPLSEWFDRRVANANAGLAGQSGLPPIAYNLASSSAGRPLYDNMKMWSPRLALAISPQSDTALAKIFFGGPNKGVLRLGWGLYYDSFGPGLLRGYDASALGLTTSINNSSGRLTLAEAPRFTGAFNIPQALVSAPPPASFPVTQPNNFAITNSLDDKLPAPYVMRYNVSLQREIKDGWNMNIAYVASAGRRTMTSEDMATPLNIRDPQSGATWFEASRQLLAAMGLDSRNQLSFNPANLRNIRPIPYFENLFAPLAGNGLTATQQVAAQFVDFHPDATGVLENIDRFGDPNFSRLGRFAFYSPQYSFLRAIRSVGFSSYNSMQVGMRKQFKNADQIDFNWTWSHSIDLGSTTENNADAGRGIIINPYQRRLMRGSSDFDQRHNVNLNYVYNLPLGQGARYLSNLGSVANHILGGWQVSGLARWTTGLPASVGHNRTWPTNYNWSGWATTVGVVNDGTNKNAQSPVQIANAANEARNSGPNIFQDPRVAQQSFGFTLPGGIGDRNHVRGDGIFNIDMSLAKNFKMPLENHTLQFRWEVFNLTNTVRFDPLNANIGLSQLSNFGKYTGTLQPSRVMQVSLRYDF